MKLGGKFAHRRSDENWDAFIKNLESKKWMAEAQATGVEELHHDPDLQCEHCGSDRLELVSQTPKPTWKELFWRESETCPSLYAERQLESHRQFWTVEYGSDFYDWYLET